MALAVSGASMRSSLKPSVRVPHGECACAHSTGDDAASDLTSCDLGDLGQDMMGPIVIGLQAGEDHRNGPTSPGGIAARIAATGKAAAPLIAKLEAKRRAARTDTTEPDPEATRHAVPSRSGLPIATAQEVRDSMQRFDDFDFDNTNQKHAAHNRIVFAARALGVKSIAFQKSQLEKLDYVDSDDSQETAMKKEMTEQEAMRAMQARSAARSTTLYSRRDRTVDPNDLASRNARGETAAKPSDKAKAFGGPYEGGETKCECTDAWQASHDAIDGRCPTCNGTRNDDDERTDSRSLMSMAPEAAAVRASCIRTADRAYQSYNPNGVADDEAAAYAPRASDSEEDAARKALMRSSLRSTTTFPRSRR